MQGARGNGCRPLQIISAIARLSCHAYCACGKLSCSNMSLTRWRPTKPVSYSYAAHQCTLLIAGGSSTMCQWLGALQPPQLWQGSVRGAGVRGVNMKCMLGLFEAQDQVQG
jgi:hypothetical protein